LQPFSNACHTVLAVPFSFAAVFQCLPYCSCCTIQFCSRFPMPAILFLLCHSVLQPFSSACHTVLAVPFSFVLRRIVVEVVHQRKCCLSNWPRLFWETFALNRQTIRFIYPSPAKVLEHEPQQIHGPPNFILNSDLTVKMQSMTAALFAIFVPPLRQCSESHSAYFGKNVTCCSQKKNTY